ncbi:hypothetical protein [Mycolicibacterium sphagni]|uniref:hypothetical protein n=1 Tax=Mycolicibacterium sphagni TaxID=1786 RepID=UPI0021F396D4|nr:hypothetical protein [Mycolicibacterium sphagni]MCV7174871.1 hypothetical protein [Mycolicibacterium sphagni]
MAVQETSEHINAPVTITIDVDQLLRAWSSQGYDEPGERLIDLISGTLARQLKGDVQKAVVEAVTREAQQQVGAIVTEVIEGTIQTTNGFGESTGKTTTLRERIVAEATEQLKRKVNGRGELDRHSGVPYIEHVARQAAKDALNNELKQAIAQAVTDVKASVTQLVTAELGARITAAVIR